MKVVLKWFYLPVVVLSREQADHKIAGLLRVIRQAVDLVSHYTSTPMI